MINKLAFLVIAVFTLFLNSCAIPAALIGGGGTLYGLHKVAKHHYPNAVPDLPGLPSFSNILESSTDHNGLKSHFETNPEYGFEILRGGCSKSKLRGCTQATQLRWFTPNLPHAIHPLKPPKTLATG